MKPGKLISLLCTAVLMTGVCTSLPASAADAPEPPAYSAETDSTKATGLISGGTLSMSTGTKKVYISATTLGTKQLGKVGFTDILVQRSTNGVNSWVTEVNVPDQIITDSWGHKLSSFAVDVTGGYYYRVVLMHYAKESGWFFPGTQKVENQSNVHWVVKT